MHCPACSQEISGAARFCEACGEPLEAAQRPARAPTMVVPTVSFDSGRYRIQRLLGEGGRKRFYLARDTRLERDVAVTLVKMEGMDDATATRVRREAHALVRRVLSEPDVRAIDFTRATPAAFGAMVVRAIVKDRGQRYQTSGELLADVGRLHDSYEAAFRPECHANGTVERGKCRRRWRSSKDAVTTFPKQHKRWPTVGKGSWARRG